jgi:hypothetical protein
MRLMLAALLIGHGVAHIVGFVVPWNWSTRMAVFALLALSSAFCVIGWPEARIGLIVNAALLAALLALPELAGR